MKNTIRKTICSLLLTASVSLLPSTTIMAEGITPSTGSTQKSTEVTMEIESIYCVSVPAALTLTRGPFNQICSDVEGYYANDNNDGYWETLEIGCCGKIDTNSYVKVLLQETKLVGQKTGEEVLLKGFDMYHKNPSFYNLTSDYFTKHWNPDDDWNIGSCNYDGSVMTDIVYDTVKWGIGIPIEDINKNDVYKGNLAIDFSLIKN